jgi:predicted SAM-dependent methyltransferase
MDIQEMFSRDVLKIDLGCGPQKKKGYIGIDKIALPGVDFVYDFEKGLQFLPDNCVDEIISSHLLEHIDNLEFLLTEIHRVLKPNGVKKIIVPHFSNPYYYSDYTHKRFFGLYTFDYFSDGNNKYTRKVPTFYNTVKFEVVSRKLRFASPPFYLRNKFKAILTHLVNSTVYTQELYEDLFSNLISCYEIHYEIRPIK